MRDRGVRGGRREGLRRVAVALGLLLALTGGDARGLEQEVDAGTPAEDEIQAELEAPEPETPPVPGEEGVEEPPATAEEPGTPTAPGEAGVEQPPATGEEPETPPAPGGEGAEEPPATAAEAAEEAAAEQKAPAEEEPRSPVQWAPPLPSATAFDWVQMSSGEWLKGELRTLRDYEVEFDSDEFDLLDLDWDKVITFYLPRPHSFRVGRRVLFGTAELRGQVLRIRTADGVQEFDRQELESIAQGSGSELDWWTLRLGLSMSIREGNTKQEDLSGSGMLRRETALTRFQTDYRGSFSKVDGDKTANNHRLYSKFDLFLTRRLFWTIPFVEYYTDEFQNIDARVTPGSALGYEFVRNSWVEAEWTVGAAYQLTRLDADVDEKRTSNDFAGVTSLEANFDLPGGTELDNLYRLQLVATDFGKTSHHSESVLSLDVWDPLDLDVSFIWDRIEDPAGPDPKDGDNSTRAPKKDDFRILVGFSLDL